FFSSRRRHTRFSRDWSSDVCSSDLLKKSRQSPASFLLLLQCLGGLQHLVDVAGYFHAAPLMAQHAVAVDQEGAAIDSHIFLAVRSEERRVGQERRYLGVGKPRIKTI